ncbi:PQQ-binding-like beta-propeller repeat protein [Niabella hirudinis]|uniref:outer membrane protein assembly factor BamB family protein n=1 Tax=Niabella hirudinis TaxID=1285929 RepID=UPI003EBAC7FE
MKKITFILLFSLCVVCIPKAQTPSDAPDARAAAIARLQKAASCKSCTGSPALFMPYGTSCNSREFQAPPILAAPKKQWEINPGWWGVWTPVLIGNLVLTGSCNNDDNAGLSAIDKQTGKTVWRIGNICATGNRRGSMGNIALYELPSGEALLVYPREDGGPTDYYVINIKTGKIVRTLTPAKTGTLRYRGGIFTTLNQSPKEGNSYITALSGDLNNILWQNREFKLAMPDKSDPLYTPTFSAPASWGGILFQTARNKDQSEPFTRQLQAIDLKTGKTLWRHTAQPVLLKRNEKSYRSDDGIPMIADGKVIIRVQAMSWPNAYATGLRALDPNSGKILWTTQPVPGLHIFNHVAACSMLVTEVQLSGKKELWGYRLNDGTVAWRRVISKNAQLMTSSGGAFYVGERLLDNENNYKDHLLQGFDGLTGTLLWTGSYPDHYFGLGNSSNSWDIENPNAGTPVWAIDRDGAIYGVTLRGVFKLK